MSDLTEYDRAIVAAAEAFVDVRQDEVGAVYQRLDDAVQTKRDAQQPKCGFILMERPWGMCGERSTQEISMPPDGTKTYRCDLHRIEAREL